MIRARLMRLELRDLEGRDGCFSASSKPWHRPKTPSQEPVFHLLKMWFRSQFQGSIICLSKVFSKALNKKNASKHTALQCCSGFAEY